MVWSQFNLYLFKNWTKRGRAWNICNWSLFGKCSCTVSVGNNFRKCLCLSSYWDYWAHINCLHLAFDNTPNSCKRTAEVVELLCDSTNPFGTKTKTFSKYKPFTPFPIIEIQFSRCRKCHSAQSVENQYGLELFKVYNKIYYKRKVLFVLLFYISCFFYVFLKKSWEVKHLEVVPPSPQTSDEEKKITKKKRKPNAQKVVELFPLRHI